MKIKLDPQPPEKKRRNRPSVLVPTTPRKLTELVGEDAAIMVGRKSLSKILSKKQIEGL
jgi:hypothetical protein